MFGRNKPEWTAAPDHEMFTIFDSKTGAYELPSFAINGPDMLRAIYNVFRSPDRQQNRLWINSEDFQLFKVGTYSKQTGKVEGCTPTHVANLHEIRAAVMAEQPPARDVRVKGPWIPEHPEGEKTPTQ